MSVAKREKIYSLRGPFGRKAVIILGAIKGHMKVDRMLLELSEIDRLLGTTTQVFDASAVAGKTHLVSGTLSALTAQAEERNFTQSLKLEVLCHVASDKQITRALKKVGIAPRTKELVFVVIDKSPAKVRKAAEEIFSRLNLKRNDNVIKLNRKKQRGLIQKYSISHSALESSSVEDLILERISLLSLS